MRPLLLALALCALAPSLTVGVAAQGAEGEAGGEEYGWSGRLSFDEPTFIGPGRTLRVAPGTTISGTAHIEVQGSLVVEGEPDRPVEFSLPVVLVGQGPSTFRNARFWGVNATALNVSSGEALLENVTFDGNTRGLLVAGEGRARVKGGAFLDHVGEAISVEGGATLEVADAKLARNGRGIQVFSAARVAVSESEFSANGQHVLIDLWPWSVPGTFTLAKNRFLAPTPAPAALPAIHLRHDRSLAQDQPARVVELRDNRIEGAEIGLRAEGRGLVVDSENDTFVDNALGVSSQLASVTLRRATLGNERDVDGSSITLEDPTYLQEGPSPPTPAATEPTPFPWGWVALAAVVVLGGVVAAVALRRREAAARAARAARTAPARRASPARAPDAEATNGDGAPAAAALDGGAPVAAAEGATGASSGVRRVDLATPITSLERRILEDILANPGTSQRAVADRLGYTRQALHYHVKRLEARGLVDKTIEGRETRCAVPGEVAQLLSTPAVTQTGSQEKA